MASAFERGLSIVELLAGKEAGLPLHQIADTLVIPRSAAHRLLAELIDAGFVHQKGEMGNYALGLKIAALGLRHLAANDLVSVSKPILDSLAERSQELVRLAMVDTDNNTMVWAVKAQGMRSGLRYDPESGVAVTLSCSATGLGWMSFIPEQEALTRILQQGIGSREDFAPNAPQTIDELREIMETTRKQGYAIAIDMYTRGIGSVAAPVFDGDSVAGVLSVAGPTARLDEARLRELSVPLREAAQELTTLLEQTAGALDGRVMDGA
ncbi:hypothetical protein BOH66_06285 [Microbacterium aurum]|uniref:IclR family transcriptional regulator n=1 Tax=Microbacterium aurum TaxID=36805 RepID=A0A1P8U708_9MICO|nr:IclR family transcriptional regulator [Microbacterium aurum]APZ33907.1 hypothetical protein BOH66_06285 [Microbacterium aurum]MBM7827668.1 DNA-binding IclR family transcriptional regulator [Microbacterium aurum]